MRSVTKRTKIAIIASPFAAIAKWAYRAEPLLATANFPKPLFNYFVTQLECFLFYYIFTKTPTRDIERNFSRWADDLRAIGELTDQGMQERQLNAFVANRFEKNMAGKSQELTDALKRYTRHSMQQYRTRLISLW